MAFEMLMLGFSTLLLTLSWVPGSVVKYRLYGANWLLKDESAETMAPVPDGVRRCARMQADLMRSYVPFAVAVLLLAFTGGFTPGTALASAVFLGACLVQVPAAISNLGAIRLLAWLGGFVATLYLLFMALVALVSF
ncbi:MAG TPA: MAPEG family protein [Gammaproteobacteria bacterium]|nr:MAPEG family protein [Gammaproteobacteria bacterium]